MEVSSYLQQPNSSVRQLNTGMKAISIFFPLSFFLLISFLGEVKAAVLPAAQNKNGLYIVYLGAAASTNGSLRTQHAQLLRSVLRGKPNAVVRTYKHGFSGFAARLSEEEAHSIAKNPGVVSVFPDPLLNLHTTRSWDFLKYQTALKVDSNSDSNSSSQASDTIIGILDTGIWPESESFNDKGFDPIPSRWKGKCMEASDFSSSNCNRKLIGARFYNDDDERGRVKVQSARDEIGHGTHVASTAAGSSVEGVSYYGLAEGTAKARALVRPDCHRIIPRGGERIIVVCSAGNDGPSTATVANVAPWILTVAASTIDRDFESDVVFGPAGSSNLVKGEGINFSSLNKSADYPLIRGGAAKTSDGDENGASDDHYRPYGKINTVKSLGGIGVIIIDDISRAVAENYAAFPATVISSKDSKDILSYLNSTSMDCQRQRRHPGRQKPSLFNVVSGTSMSCPHVSGIAATVKSKYPTWTPSAIKSAIMTSATQTNNMGAPMTTDSGSTVTPYDHAISNFDGKTSRNVTRIVTNVSGDETTTFVATVDAPTGLNVQVIPDKLQFTKNNQKLSYQVVSLQLHP
ncbi:hypothetical protein FNV43_RR10494 [Rhamnella rubrinervis]|uniref:Uncharacterized protein n=1 Tax=Rhamnella rubrinervis TaxID=2594499 RepID=A0A8K0H493_9ROSA|nr:hypothetical protein FNV43_RR10494 [Rhamnella rubrinervis]